jgi:hypothetical protein
VIPRREISHPNSAGLKTGILGVIRPENENEILKPSRNEIQSCRFWQHEKHKKTGLAAGEIFRVKMSKKKGRTP